MAFIDTLQSPFYDRMIENVSLNFSNLVITEEKIEIGVRKGRIAQGAASTSANKPPVATNKRKERETNMITSTPNFPDHNHTPYYQPQYAYRPQVAAIS
ncbi:hypothetical protein CR513_13080, partial [Mucuna pruriens]